MNSNGKAIILLLGGNPPQNDVISGIDNFALSELITDYPRVEPIPNQINETLLSINLETVAIVIPCKEVAQFQRPSFETSISQVPVDRKPEIVLSDSR